MRIMEHIKTIAFGAIALVLLALVVYFLGPDRTYEKEMALGNEAYEQKQYDNSLMHYQLAYDHKETEEIKEKIKTVEDIITKKEKKVVEAFIAEIQKENYDKIWNYTHTKMHKLIKKEDFLGYYSMLRTINSFESVTIQSGKSMHEFTITVQTDTKNKPIQLTFVMEKEKDTYRLIDLKTVEHYEQKMAEVYMAFAKVYINDLEGTLDGVTLIYKQAISYDPTNFIAYRYLAGTYVQLGQNELAIDVYEQGLKVAKKQKEKKWTEEFTTALEILKKET